MNNQGTLEYTYLHVYERKKKIWNEIKFNFIFKKYLPYPMDRSVEKQKEKMSFLKVTQHNTCHWTNFVKHRY